MDVITRTDKLGTRPVYWSRSSGKLVWSNTLDDFHNAPDRLGIFQTLTIGFPIGRRSLLKDVNTLPPGHELVVSFDKVEERPYWLPPVREKKRGLIDSVQAIASAFDTFCKRLEGMSVGLGLTGGKDSRVILNALARNKIKVTCLSWRDFDFNDRIAEDLAFLVDRPHFIVKADDEQEESFLKEIASTMTGGMNRYLGFALLGKKCQRLGLNGLLTGFGGDRLSGYIPPNIHTIDKLADHLLHKQMELYSFAEAEELQGGKGELTEQTLFEWRKSFLDQEWRGDLGDVCLWQMLCNRNYKRITMLMLPANHFCPLIQPYNDDAVLDCYLSMPVEHLINQVAHCKAAYWGRPDFGKLPSTSYPIPLKWEPSSIINIGRTLKSKLSKTGADTVRRKRAMLDVVDKFCERHDGPPVSTKSLGGGLVLEPV